MFPKSTNRAITGSVNKLLTTSNPLKKNAAGTSPNRLPSSQPGNSRIALPQDEMFLRPTRSGVNSDLMHRRNAGVARIHTGPNVPFPDPSIKTDGGGAQVPGLLEVERRPAEGSVESPALKSSDAGECDLEISSDRLAAPEHQAVKAEPRAKDSLPVNPSSVKADNALAEFPQAMPKAMQAECSSEQGLAPDPGRSATVTECDVPASSVLDRSVVEAAYFKDSYRAPLSREDRVPTDIYLDVFGHIPMWGKSLLIVRNRVASMCGLEVPDDQDIMNPPAKSGYQVGDKIGPWPIYAITENEIVAGRNNKHLDFRVSVLKEMNQGKPSVVVSTVCTVHNPMGKIYLFFIEPFHRFGVRHLVQNAIDAGRL